MAGVADITDIIIIGITADGTITAAGNIRDHGITTDGTTMVGITAVPSTMAMVGAAARK